MAVYRQNPCESQRCSTFLVCPAQAREARAAVSVTSPKRDDASQRDGEDEVPASLRIEQGALAINSNAMRANVLAPAPNVAERAEHAMYENGDNAMVAADSLLELLNSDSHKSPGNFSSRSHKSPRDFMRYSHILRGTFPPGDILI